MSRIQFEPIEDGYVDADGNIFDATTGNHIPLASIVQSSVDPTAGAPDCTSGVVNDVSAGNTQGDVVSVNVLANDDETNGMLDPATVSLDLPSGAIGVVLDADGDVIGFTVPGEGAWEVNPITCLLYTSPSPRDQRGSRMPSSA